MQSFVKIFRKLLQTFTNFCYICCGYFGVSVNIFISSEAENTAVACAKHFPASPKNYLLQAVISQVLCWLETKTASAKRQAIDQTSTMNSSWLHCISRDDPASIRSLAQCFSRLHETYLDLVRRQHLPKSHC